jgi:hypothetical protein
MHTWWVHSAHTKGESLCPFDYLIINLPESSMRNGAGMHLKRTLWIRIDCPQSHNYR